ncbi:tetraacyldisaccharide 4'-kinase [Halocola ammonii]
MKVIRWFLLPFAMLYSAAVWVRNKLFDLGVIKSYEAEIPSIVVGNLSAGGTGKTPHTELLVRILHQEYFTAILSRGYGRKTRGFVMADEGLTADDLGDEPFQFHEKFGEVMIAVDENRERGIKMLMKQVPEPDVILLDDAFQHRKVKAGLYILLTSFSCPFYSDLPLPTGNLRDNKSQRKRADIIIVTKCPPFIGEEKKKQITDRIKPLPHQKVLFSSIHYAKPKAVFQNKDFQDFEEAVVVTGIANPAPLLSELEGKFDKIVHKKFPDHHSFTKADIRSITRAFDKLESNRKCIITTEKDAMRLKNHSEKGKLSELPLFYIPIEIQLLDCMKWFEEHIVTFINDFKTDV